MVSAGVVEVVPTHFESVSDGLDCVAPFHQVLYGIFWVESKCLFHVFFVFFLHKYCTVFMQYAIFV